MLREIERRRSSTPYFIEIDASNLLCVCTLHIEENIHDNPGYVDWFKKSTYIRNP